MDKNLNTYNSSSVVKWYDQLTGVEPVELCIFEMYSELLINAAVLDIGIGGGRTTKYLLNKCRSYTGIDYSEGFVTATKEKFPGIQLLKMDARDLSAFHDASFDFVNFSFNGIDYVDLKGREQIFKEIRRILKPHGIFFFSTHNRNHPTFNKDPWINKNNSPFINLKTFAKIFPFLLKKLLNKKREMITKDYAIINDSAHNYSLLTFYTSPSFLREHLNNNGLTNLVFYSRKGEALADDNLDDWIFVTCAKSNA